MRSGGVLCMLGLLLAPLPLAGQAGPTGTVAGQVTDASTGQPLVAATVILSGTSIGGLTGEDGHYSLSGVPAGSHEVEVTFIGYGAQSQAVTVSANASVTVDFELQTEAVLLEGIVAVGYGTQARRGLTGSIGSVQAEQIRQIPTSNVLHAMQGRMAGVDIVRTNSTPGAGMNIRVRGIRSMANSRNDPLIVVDGVPLSGGSGDFSPANVESIEVLKDASATAIYGSRGANGVVLITTRAGLPGQVNFTYNTYAGIQRPLNLVRMMNGPEFEEYRREANRADPNRAHLPDEDIFHPSELEALRRGEFMDWQREILRTGFQQEHQVGVTGATENTRFSLTGNFFDQRGITKAQGFDRYNASFSIDHTLGRLRVGTTGTVTRSTQVLGPGNGVWGAALANVPLSIPYDENGNVRPKASEDPLLVNPLVSLYEHRREIARNRTFGSLFAELQLTEGLNWRVNLGPDHTSRLDGEFRTRDARNNAPPDAYRQDEETFAYTLTNMLQFDRSVGGAHRFDATFVQEVQRQRFQNTRAEAEDLPYDHQLWYNLGTAGTVREINSELREWALESYMGRVNYSLLDRYLVTLTGRFDGSSRLAEGNKWSFFPSVGLGWQVGDEAFIQGVPWLTDLKLRASYGVTGNSSINPYQTQGTLNQEQYNFGDDPALGYRPGSIRNPDLDWEETTQYNVGLDFGLFNNRITGTLDAYRQDTDALLLSRGLPPASGYTSILMNIGATRNQGLEISLSTVNIENWNGLRWTMDVNATTNSNEIVRLAEGGDQVGDRWFIGQPITIGNPDQQGYNPLYQVFYDFEFDGIWQLHEEEEAASYAQVPGEIRVVDQNGDGRISADDDRIIIGTSYPTWIGSLSHRFSWRNLDLSVLATARLGYMFEDNFSSTNSALYGRYGNLAVDYWTPENPSNVHPRPDVGREGPIYGSSRHYRKGDHVRIRNVTLGYLLPESLVSRFGGRTTRLYMTVQEPYVFTSYHGYDPEAGTSGGTPSYWTLLIGANLTF